MNPCSASRKVKERLNAGFGKQGIKKPSLVYFDKHQGRFRKVSQGKVQNRYQPRQGSSIFTKKRKLPLGNLRNHPPCTVPFVGGTVWSSAPFGVPSLLAKISYGIEPTSGV
jgi:hypothetical protein